MKNITTLLFALMSLTAKSANVNFGDINANQVGKVSIKDGDDSLVILTEGIINLEKAKFYLKWTDNNKVDSIPGVFKNDVGGFVFRGIDKKFTGNFSVLQDGKEIGKIKFLKSQGNGYNDQVVKSDIRCNQYLFTPAPGMELVIESKQSCCGATMLTAPAFNKHTSHGITYNHRGDPVATWRRTGNSAIFGECGISEGNKKKKDKNMSTTEKIIQQIRDLEMQLRYVNDSLNNRYTKPKVEDIASRLNQLKNDIANEKNMDTERSEYDQRIEKIKNELNILSALYGGAYAGSSEVSKGYRCCGKLFCTRQTGHFAPKVGRSLYIGVNSYHPYRDSFVLSVSYTNRFGEHANLFEKTSGAGQTTNQGEAAAEDTTEASGVQKQMTPLELYEILLCEFKQYYERQLAKSELNVKTVQAGIDFINSRLTANELLQLKDLSPEGLKKRADELIEKQKTQQSYYLEIASQAAFWYGKILNYHTFENRSLLVQNRDEIHLKMQRYWDGKLITPDNEAIRTYNTSWGFKMDFSTGLFGNFIMDESYTTVTVQKRDTTLAIGSAGQDSIAAVSYADRDSIIRENKGNFNIGPAVYSHFYWRTGYDINVSLTLGIAINQQASPRYLAGGSILCGRESRLAISGGAAFGPQKVLAAGYEENKVVDLSSTPNNALPYVDRWKAHWFMGLSWNIGGFNIGK